MVEAFGGAIMALACIYAAINGINGLLRRPRHRLRLRRDLGRPAVPVSMLMAGYVRRRARRMQSGLLAMDARGWMVSGFHQHGPADRLRGRGRDRRQHACLAHPLPDSAICCASPLAMLPLPMLATWRPVREVLQVAPSELDQAGEAQHAGNGRGALASSATPATCQDRPGPLRRGARAGAAGYESVRSTHRSRRSYLAERLMRRRRNCGSPRRHRGSGLVLSRAG
jgi:hypothetical protein